MVTRIGIAAPAKLLILFLALAGIPLGTLGWLGWRLLEQDRALENQRVHERLDNAAGLLARELDRGLSTWESLLPTLAQGTFVALPPNAVAVRFDAGGVRDHRGVPVPYYPLVPSPPETSGSLFAAGEAYEFRDGALAAAIDLYRRVASTRDGGIRAAALMRLARALRKQRRVNEALAAYGELAAMRDTPVAGSPSELVARRERIGLFTGIGDQKAAEREAEALASALFEGRYRLDRATFDFYRQSTSLEPPDDGAFDVARAIEEFWPTWQQQATGRSAWAGDHGRTWAAVWRRTPNGTAAIVGRADTLLIESLAVVRDAQVRVALHDPSGRVALGAAAADAPHVTKTFRETGLPWDVRVAPADPDLAPQIFASRRNLLTAGLGLMVLVIAAASYFVFRAVNRELAVARLQSDFVATVSHEFRTPLAAMRHLTEMLEDGGVPADRVPRYYRALGKEARRLHAMVESLLDFGRMEAGRRAYRMEEMAAAELAEQVVSEFREHVALAPQRIELQVHDRVDDMRIWADREAIALALRNLLDNAIKYSPDSSTVHVSIDSADALTRISVADQGPGIPPAEQRDIFSKFVRGTAARALNVKGTGIGLAIADHIVKDHGGRLEVTSEPGRGSRFTILLPAAGTPSRRRDGDPADRDRAGTLQPGA